MRSNKQTTLSGAEIKPMSSKQIKIESFNDVAKIELVMAKVLRQVQRDSRLPNTIARQRGLGVYQVVKKAFVFAGSLFL